MKILFVTIMSGGMKWGDVSLMNKSKYLLEVFWYLLRIENEADRLLQGGQVMATAGNNVSTCNNLVKDKKRWLRVHVIPDYSLMNLTKQFLELFLQFLRFGNEADRLLQGGQIMATAVNNVSASVNSVKNKRSWLRVYVIYNHSLLSLSKFFLGVILQLLRFGN